jgi:hypothetical protein
MLSPCHVTVLEEAERRAAQALAEFIYKPSTESRAEFWRQLGNLRTANLSVARHRERPEPAQGREGYKPQDPSMPQSPLQDGLGRSLPPREAA